MSTHTVLIYSGGLDSTVLLYKLLAEGHQVYPLSVNYGQRHSRELQAAQAICLELGLEYRLADLSCIAPLLAGSSQTSPDVAVPEGHYAEESMKQTVVPNRNMILLSVAIGYAISRKADAVMYAAHAGDHHIYPDCRPEFINAMYDAALLCDWHPIKVYAPFRKFTKADIVTEGARLKVPFERTWSCYKGGKRPCGRCGTDIERIEAFKIAGVADPTDYADKEFWKAQVAKR